VLLETNRRRRREISRGVSPPCLSFGVNPFADRAREIGLTECFLPMRGVEEEEPWAVAFARYFI
jgi:hypothetical protein